MSPPFRFYLLTEHVLGAAVINFLLNGLIAWLSFRHLDAVPLWGAQSIGGDMIGTMLVLPTLTCLIVTRIVHRDLRRGRIDRSDLPATLRAQAFWPLRALPDGILARGLAVAAVTTLFAAPLLIALLTAGGVAALDLRSFVLFKAIYAAGLAAMVQPAIAVRAVMDDAGVAHEAGPLSA